MLYLILVAGSALSRRACFFYDGAHCVCLFADDARPMFIICSLLEFALLLLLLLTRATLDCFLLVIARNVFPWLLVLVLVLARALLPCLVLVPALCSTCFRAAIVCLILVLACACALLNS